MDDCEHFWVNISSKRQRAWQCSHCGELRLDDPTQKREWQGLTDGEYEAMAEQHITNCYFDTLKYAYAIEEALRRKNT
jgi:hypothetical protein